MNTSKLLRGNDFNLGNNLIDKYIITQYLASFERIVMLLEICKFERARDIMSEN